MEDGSWGWNVFFFSIFFSSFPPLFQVYLKCASASVFCLFGNVTVNLFKKKKDGKVRELTIVSSS